MVTLRVFSRPTIKEFLISDIRALWRSGLSARVAECQKLKWQVRPLWRSVTICGVDDDDDNDEIAYFTVRWKI